MLRALVVLLLAVGSRALPADSWRDVHPVEVNSADVAPIFIRENAAQTSPTLDGKIVGGTPVSISEVPYQLSLRIYGTHSCGASIISSEWAISAAHCAIGLYPNSVTLRSGSSNRLFGGTIHKVKAIIVHPNYSDETLLYDFSLFRVTKKFSFSSNVRPVALPSPVTKVAAGTVAVVSGWGVRKEGSIRLPIKLQQVLVPIVSQSDCNAQYEGAITDTMICAGYTEGGKDACQGDSGGPLVSNGTLIGVVSWGIGCAQVNTSGVYSRVSSARDWITTITGI